MTNHDLPTPAPPVHPVPGYLLQRYRGWKATDHAENHAWYRRLAEEGQRPRCMVISCCDSRVHVTQLFGAGPGEFFLHRNIANLVPPYLPDRDHHGTSAALEYAVRRLKVSNLVVLAHSLCGGVNGCRAMCSGEAPDLDDDASFVGRWLDILRPGYERVRHLEDPTEQQMALEWQTVIVSLENLMTFPFVSEAVDEGRLGLHGMWVDISTGALQVLNGTTGLFEPV